MTTEEMTLICELTNYTSFLEASYYMPYSPSTIAKYVGSVEEELGVKLFIRSNKIRELSLTDEGKKLIDAFRRLNDDWHYLQKQLNYVKTDENKKIRIGSQPRFGNIHEQKILAAFLFDNPAIQLNVTKAPADELIRNMISEKLDAAFITFNNTLNLKEYFSEHGDKLLATQIWNENDMYVGISDRYFPDKNEVQLKDLSEFTFALPFQEDNDLQSTLAKKSWMNIEKEKGISLKYMHLQGYDNTIFEMARLKKIAVSTTHIPLAQYEGIKFIRISDWSGGTRLYFIRRPLNESSSLQQLEKCVNTYIQSHNNL